MNGMFREPERDPELGKALRLIEATRETGDLDRRAGGRRVLKERGIDVIHLCEFIQVFHKDCC